jgi:hypothetical protein
MIAALALVWLLMPGSRTVQDSDGWADALRSTHQAPTLDRSNTWLMPQTISPAAGLNSALTIRQHGVGALGDSRSGPIPFRFAYNYFSVNDQIRGPGDGSFTTMGLGVRLATGGPAVEGTRAAIYAENALVAATSAENINRFWAGGGFVGRVSTNDHGTSERPRGAIFGGFSAALFDKDVGAKLSNATAWEHGIAVTAGNKVAYKTLLQLASLPVDEVHGSIEAQIAFSGNAGSVGWSNALLLTDANGRQPLTSAGCILCTSFVGNPIISKGIDISAYRPMGNAFASHGFAVTGDGYVRWAGQGILRTRLSKRDATLEDVDGLSVVVASGGTYSFDAKLFFDVDGRGGVAFALGGTAVETSIIYQITHICSAKDSKYGPPHSSRILSRASRSVYGSCSAGYTQLAGTIEIGTGGTLTIQFAREKASGTVSLLPGSTLSVSQF